MELKMDADVKAAAEFLQANFAASKLVAISESLRAVAPLLWGHCDGREAIKPLELTEPMVPKHSDQSESSPKGAT